MAGDGAGPELVRLPRGYRFNFNPESSSMMALAGGGGRRWVIQNAVVRSERDIGDIAYQVDD